MMGTENILSNAVNFHIIYRLVDGADRFYRRGTNDGDIYLKLVAHLAFFRVHAMLGEEAEAFELYGKGGVDGLKLMAVRKADG
jgi:hypothetical protein